VFDMTNRSSDAIDRAEARTGLEFAEGLVGDAAALKALAPGWNGKDMREAALEIMRGSALSFVVGIERGDCRESIIVHTSDRSWPGSGQYPSAHHETALVGLLLGILSGWDFGKCVQNAIKVAG